MSVDYLSDWREAQVAGHHSDCDGFMAAHRTKIVRDEYGLMRAVCDECGPLHVGSFGKDAELAVRKFLSHEQQVRCDMRCGEWT